MNAVIEKIAIEDAEQLAKDQARYAELLVAGDPTPAEVKELRGLLQRLGKSAADLQRDHNLIQDVARLQAAIDQGDGIEPQILAAERAKNEFYEETQRIKAEREKKARLLSNESERLQSIRFGAIDATGRLNQVVNQNPDLFRVSRSSLVKEVHDHLPHNMPRPDVGMMTTIDAGAR